MKRFVLISLMMLGALAVSGGLWPSARGKAAPRRESAVVEFTQIVKLQDVLLKGQYLIVHDEERMARGEPCTYIYHGDRVIPAKLVIAFHCIPVERDRAEGFKVTLSHRAMPYEMPEVTEYQFAGSTEGHKVPGI
jgi:hypothetical protein